MVWLLAAKSTGKVYAVSILINVVYNRLIW